MPKRRMLNWNFEFVEGPKGPLFMSTVSPPEGISHKGSILYFHPFGEEMNKSRRMVAWQSRAFASLGYTVRTVDLPGCGDSHGLLEEASWNDWQDAAKTCVDKFVGETDQPITLWGLRLGALLCADVASQREQSIDRLIFWQPILDGKSVVSSLFRLARAGGLQGQPGKTSEADDPRKLLQERSMVEIGGYCISGLLVTSLEQQSLSNFLADSCQIIWLDVGSREQARPSFAAERLIRVWETQGATINWSHVRGDAFWGTVEISDNPALINATCHAIEMDPNSDA